MRLQSISILLFSVIRYGLSQSTSSGTATAAAATQTISVGINWAFQPENITADPGDLLVFEFLAPGHSVVKAEYGYPCIPYDTMNRGQPSFFSGFFNGSDTSSNDPPTWNITVNETSPVFFYCSAITSCLEHHMLGVINGNATQNLTGQTDMITSTSIMLQPGEPYPSEGSNATTTSKPTTSHTSLSGGAIAGIVVGGVVFIALVGALIWYMSRSRTLKQVIDSQAKPETEEHEKQKAMGPMGPLMASYNGVSGGIGSDSDRWSTSYGGSPPPDNRKTYSITDSLGRPIMSPPMGSSLGDVQELDHGEDERIGRRMYRSSGASELAGESEDRRKEGRLSPPINTDTIHELD